MKIDIKKWLGPAYSLVDRYKYVLIVILVGAIFILWPQSTSEQAAAEEPSAAAETQNGTQETLAQELETVLSQAAGVGRVQVLLTLQEGEERIYAQDTRAYRKTLDGGEDTTDESNIAILSKTGGGEEPVTVKTVAPAYRGALIVCDGADSAVVRLQVTQCVSALTGLSSNQISVIKMKN